MPRLSVKLFRYPRAVLWAFMGLRRGAAARADLDAASPERLRLLPLLATVVGLAALLVLLLLGLARTAAAAPALVVPDTLGQRLQACTACHGAQGGASRDGFVPRIAGKPAGYLEQQLLNFRDGRRPHRSMAVLLENLDADYLREIAAYFAAQTPPQAPAPAAPPLRAEAAHRAEQLLRQGDPARQLPACTACHGARLSGVQPGVPGLLGLPADYLLAQLGAWREGKRQARAPDCMAQIAQRLTESEVGLLAQWLAAQPLPEPASAAAQAPGPWPMACGGIAP